MAKFSKSTMDNGANKVSPRRKLKMEEGEGTFGDSYFKTEDMLPPTTDLSDFMEYYVNSLKPGIAQHVYVRVMSNIPKTMNVSESVRTFFNLNGISSEFPYKHRVIMLFQKTNTGLFAFFAVCCQEYDSSCPPPNTDKAYIEILDSVHLYEPSDCRRDVYFTVLFCYLHFLTSEGYKSVHLWSCPPKNGEEYIFHCRPVSQKPPTGESLRRWYKTFMLAAVGVGVLDEFKNLLEWCPTNCVDFFHVFPFFYEDLWSTSLDAIIEKFHNQKHESPPKKKRKSKSESTKKKGIYHNNISACVDIKEFVFLELFAILKDVKDDFFVMSLKGNQKSTFSDKQEFKDVLRPSLFLDSRDFWVTYLKKQDLRFCDTLTAERSTEVFLLKIYSEQYYKNKKDKDENSYCCKQKFSKTMLLPSINSRISSCRSACSD